MNLNYVVGVEVELIKESRQAQECATYFPGIHCSLSRCALVKIGYTLLVSNYEEKTFSVICRSCKTSLSMYLIEKLLG